MLLRQRKEVQKVLPGSKLTIATSIATGGSELELERRPIHPDREARLKILKQERLVVRSVLPHVGVRRAFRAFSPIGDAVQVGLIDKLH